MLSLHERFQGVHTETWKWGGAGGRRALTGNFLVANIFVIK